MTRVQDFHGENPGIDLSHPNDGGHVSQDYPFWEIGNYRIENPDDESLGFSMVNTPG
jgi:hypothetical protein